ncbi:hypothetical protein [Terriglobus albidus]|uniref:hypothetical protein n=1 Tax=Terriglobus albidus TaxID=1592106 RepID=UPI003D7C34BB
MLLAEVRGGVNGLMAEVMEDHIRHHLSEGGEAQGLLLPEPAEDLMDPVTFVFEIARLLCSWRRRQPDRCLQSAQYRSGRAEW